MPLVLESSNESGEIDVETAKPQQIVVRFSNPKLAEENVELAFLLLSSSSNSFPNKEIYLGNWIYDLISHSSSHFLKAFLKESKKFVFLFSLFFY